MRQFLISHEDRLSYVACTKCSMLKDYHIGKKIKSKVRLEGRLKPDVYNVTVMV